MTGRRAVRQWDERLSRALQFVPGHVGGRVASAQPIRRRGGTLRQASVGAVTIPPTTFDLFSQFIVAGNSNCDLSPWPTGSGVVVANAPTAGRPAVIFTNYDFDIFPAADSFADPAKKLTNAYTDTVLWAGQDSANVSIIVGAAGTGATLPDTWDWRTAGAQATTTSTIPAWSGTALSASRAGTADMVVSVVSAVKAASLSAPSGWALLASGLVNDTRWAVAAVDAWAGTEGTDWGVTWSSTGSSGTQDANGYAVYSRSFWHAVGLSWQTPRVTETADSLAGTWQT